MRTTDPGLVLAVCACLCARVALAQPAAAVHDWDGTYARGSASGAWPCPAPSRDVVISGGRFSIAWDVVVDADGKPATVTIGHVDGTVRADGHAVATTTLAPRLQRPFVIAMAREHASIAALRRVAMTVELHAEGGARELALTGNGCSAAWNAEAGKPPPATEPDAVDCNTGTYAVALWAATRAYKPGAYARLAIPGDTTRLYRCAHDCAEGISPGAGDAWVLAGRCAGQSSPAAAPPDPRWDATYVRRASSVGNWRCPSDDDLAKLVVAHGRFSIPWNLHAAGGNVPVGRIDGVVAADGSVAVAPTLIVQQLPGALAASGSIEALRATHPTITFALAAAGRRAHFELAEDCEVALAATDAPPPRVACEPNQGWDSTRSYDASAEVTRIDADNVRRRYRCNQRPRCAAGARPDQSAQWDKLGRCE